MATLIEVIYNATLARCKEHRPIYLLSDLSWVVNARRQQETVLVLDFVTKEPLV